MTKKIIFSFLISLMIPITSFADSDQVSKDLWLKQFKELAPAAMCHRLLAKEAAKDVMEKNGIDYEKCVPLITKSMDTCLTKYSTQLPATFDVASGSKWGKQIGICSGADFYTNNLAK